MNKRLTVAGSHTDIYFMPGTFFSNLHRCDKKKFILDPEHMIKHILPNTQPPIKTQWSSYQVLFRNYFIFGLQHNNICHRSAVTFDKKKVCNFTLVWSNFDNSFISWLLKNTPSYNGLKVAQKVQFVCDLIIETIVRYFEGNRANPQTMNWPKNITHILSEKISQIRFDDLFIHFESKAYFFQIALFSPLLLWVDHGINE